MRAQTLQVDTAGLEDRAAMVAQSPNTTFSKRGTNECKADAAASTKHAPPPILVDDPSPERLASARSNESQSSFVRPPSSSSGSKIHR
eukprot:377874-Rhodomonas_salina.5